MSRHLLFLIAAFCICFDALQAPRLTFAGEPLVGTVEFVKTESFVCRKLAENPDSTSQYGYVRMLTAPKGKAFLVLWTQLKPKFAKNEDGDQVVEVSDEHMSLKDSKGNVSRVVGTCTRDGRFQTDSGWIGENKEYFDEEYLDYNPVFVVAAGEQEFTLQIAGQAHKVTAAMQIADKIDRTRAADIQIKDVSVITDLSRTTELREYEDDEIKDVSEQVLSPSTKYLAVKFLVQPKMSNQDNEAFYSYSHEFGLRYGAQVYVAPVGYLSRDEFRDGSTSEGDEADAAGKFPAHELHLVFPLPGRLTSFRALYLMQEFGGGKIPQG